MKADHINQRRGEQFEEPFFQCLKREQKKDKRGTLVKVQQ